MTPSSSAGSASSGVNLFREITRRQLVFDISLAIFCVLLRLAITVAEPAMYVVVIIMATALALRRASPALALIVAWVGAGFQLVAQLGPDVSNLAILAVLFTTAAYGGRVLKWAGLVSAIAGSLVIAIYLTIDVFLGGAPLNEVIQVFAGILIFALVGLGLSWTLGLLARTRRLAGESRSAQAKAEAEQRIAQREVIVEQERNRIARDMHDIVAHSLAVVIAQSDGARYARLTDPTAVDGALTTISSTAREALGDVRLLLSQLRHNQAEGPQPSLADLDRLVGQLRQAGLSIEVRETGEPLPLAQGQQLAAYRVIQEALTNALRHGDVDQPVELEIAWSPLGLHVTVTNHMRADAQLAPPLGHGLAGMRERAVLAGGDLTARPTSGLFVVSLSLPHSVPTTTAPTLKESS
ncbi:sensor histidine kinase [Salinibacterium hongtaonis]|uniref:histidine kinase n=1 Tax=Homoserinimonas hongtaonis TaxID=2079791 RepID=A0A2U1SYZ5_9MICO|nr:histidine kinase [Salinibacterium hongtaonis]PWB96850.1 sensor histidine kinase [Salinibacterium hongtaonis]